jgi:acetyl-CoA carboxylase biotin carboxyl carrier protein
MGSLKIDESAFDRLAEILKRHALTEIEYRQGDVRIKMSVASSQRVPVDSRTAAEQEQAIEESKSIITEESQNYSDHEGAVRAQMVGTCYLAPEPGARNFVEIGDVVQEGQPILIIEAMKVMNLIKSPKSGKIVHIAVSNSAPVEFGQLLIVIE